MRLPTSFDMRNVARAWAGVLIWHPLCYHIFWSPSTAVFDAALGWTGEAKHVIL